MSFKECREKGKKRHNAPTSIKSKLSASRIPKFALSSPFSSSCRVHAKEALSQPLHQQWKNPICCDYMTNRKRSRLAGMELRKRSIGRGDSPLLQLMHRVPREAREVAKAESAAMSKSRKAGAG
jgi:hypothetical protein